MVSGQCKRKAQGLHPLGFFCGLREILDVWPRTMTPSGLVFVDRLESWSMTDAACSPSIWACSGIIAVLLVLSCAITSQATGQPPSPYWFEARGIPFCNSGSGANGIVLPSTSSTRRPWNVGSVSAKKESPT